MIEREGTGDGWQVRFVPTTGQRLVRMGAAAFLCLWLCGWAMGEYFAGGTLAGMLAARYAPGVNFDWLPHARFPATGAATPAMLFLCVWVTAWTIGGCFAIGSLLSLLFGVQVLRWGGSGVELATQVGPFSTRRRLTWDQAEALVSGTAGPQRASGTALRFLAGPLCETADCESVVGWLREARTAAGGAGEPERVRAIG